MKQYFAELIIKLEHVAIDHLRGRKRATEYRSPDGTLIGTWAPESGVSSEDLGLGEDWGQAS